MQAADRLAYEDVRRTHGNQGVATLLAALCAPLVFGQANEQVNPAEVPTSAVSGSSARQVLPSAVTSALLDTRSGLITHPGAGAGGADVSRLQNTSLGMGTIGFASSISVGFRLAEDFVVPAGGWTLDSVTVYAYQTGSTATSTFNDFRFQIWNAPPNVSGSAVVYGNTTTNADTSSVFSGIYRDIETGADATNRPIMAITASGLSITLRSGPIGSNDSFTVVLKTMPTGNVVVTLTPNAQVTTSPSTLTFTPANWNVAQTVTVTAVDDAVIEGAHTGSVAFAVTSTDTSYNGFAVASVAVNITDNDAAGATVAVAGGALNLREGARPARSPWR